MSSQVDLHFMLQPTTIPSGPGTWSPQAVVTLVIEINPNAGPTDTYPFKTLIDGVANWLFENHAGTGNLATQIDNIVAYVKTSFYADVETCLRSQFTFTISPSSNTLTDTPVAVFAMFPELQYNYAPLGSNVDFSTRTVPPGYVQSVANYFGNPGQPGPSGGSFAGLVRTDYFVLLAKQLGSNLQDFAKKNPTSTSFSDALASVNYTALAGMASRFMQHGLRLPDPVTPSTLTGLYVLTGQQVALQQAAPGGGGVPQWDTAVTLMPGAGAAGWITLLNSGNGNASITDALPVELVSELVVAVEPSWIQNSLQALEPLKPVPLKYTLIQPLLISSGGTTLSARAIPHAAQVEVAAATSQMYLEITEGPTSGTVQASNDAPPPPPAPFNAAAVLIARIGIRQIQKPGANAGTFYEDVFQLMGTDEQSRDLIDTLLDGGPGSFTLDLLIPQGQSAYASTTAADNAILAKVNLSTVAEPNASIMLHALAAQADPVSPNFALTADAEKFLRLVWECSVVHTGGFFLHCQNFPSAQFTKATSAGGQTSNAPGEASLYVLVNLVPFGTLPDNQPAVNLYHNALLLSSDTAKKAVAATVMHLNLESPTQKTPVYVWQPNFPGGSTGFQVTWPNAPYQLPPLTQNSSSTDVSNYLEMLYHFLQYQVVVLPNATVSLPSNWSAPAGAGSIDHGGGNHSWYFRQTDQVVEYIGANANRYAAVGQAVEFDVRLLDVFGNTLPDALTQKVTPTVAYNDPLISFAHWPGVHVGYQISAGAPDPVLTIDFAYTPSPAQNASSDRMQETIRIYQLVLDQLNDPNTSVTIATTLEAQPLSQTAGGGKIKDQLQAYVTNIMGSLQSSGTDPILLALTLNLTGSFDYVKGLPSDLFVIVVQGIVARVSTALDPTLVSLLPKIGMISHEIFPDLTVPDVSSNDPGDDDKQSLANRVFAQAFEAAYVGFDGAGGLLKVGSGPQPGAKDDDDDDRGFGGGIDKAVWALRWSQGDGVNVSFANAASGPQIQQKPAYYASPPLSTELLSPTFTMVVYGDQTTEVTHRFSEIDLDGWMSDFLNAVHALFEAQMAPAIATLDPTAYNQLLSDKEAIAQSISARLENVFVAMDPKKMPSPLPVGDAEVAQETFKQALLTSLTNDYATSAIVQVPAQVVVAGTLESPVAGHDGQTIPARLFGKVSTNKPDDGTSPYTISPASLPIPNGQSTACVTFLVAAKQPKNQADLNLKQLFYDIGFLEHDFEMLEGHYGYIPSSWVTFSLPQATTGGSHRAPLSPLMGEVDIPIPLRTFPQAPTLFKQTATADTGDNPLAQLDWDYELTVSNLRDVAQDELWLELTFNDLVNAPGADPDAGSNAGGSHPIMSRTLERPPPADLLEALARFTWEYPQILPDLQKVPEQAYSSSKDPAPDLALERMVALIGGVRNRIDSWKNPALPDARMAARLQASNANDSVPHFSWVYKIEPEKGHDGSPTGNLLVTRTKDDQNLWPPWPTIVGYSTPSSSGEQDVYTLSGTEPAQWVVTWKGLYLMTHQSARIAAWVERNDDLSEDPDLATNPEFIYKTPIVTFGSPIVPLIDIEPAQPQPQQPNFLQAFNDVFTVFTQTDTDNRTPLELKFTLETGYEYVVAKQNDQQLTTRAPIFFARGDVATPSNQTGTPPQTLDAFEKGAAQMLQHWQSAQQPNPTGAFISLRLTVFATVSDGQLPLAVFRDIQLPVGSDQNWWMADG